MARKSLIAIYLYPMPLIASFVTDIFSKNMRNVSTYDLQWHSCLKRLCDYCVLTITCVHFTRFGFKGLSSHQCEVKN